MNMVCCQQLRWSRTKTLFTLLRSFILAADIKNFLKGAHVLRSEPLVGGIFYCYHSRPFLMKTITRAFKNDVINKVIMYSSVHLFWHPICLWGQTHDSKPVSQNKWNGKTRSLSPRSMNPLQGPSLKIGLLNYSFFTDVTPFLFYVPLIHHSLSVRLFILARLNKTGESSKAPSLFTQMHLFLYQPAKPWLHFIPHPRCIPSLFILTAVSLVCS